MVTEQHALRKTISAHPVVVTGLGMIEPVEADDHVNDGPAILIYVNRYDPEQLISTASDRRLTHAPSSPEAQIYG